jgi:hypothetical protein
LFQYAAPGDFNPYKAHTIMALFPESEPHSGLRIVHTFFMVGAALRYALEISAPRRTFMLFSAAISKASPRWHHEHKRW